MGTQYETVSISIGGANPQALTVTVPVDTTTGSGTATLTYTGKNGGDDTLVGRATIAGALLESNSAAVNWQQSNGQLQIGSVVTTYAWNDSPTSGPVAGYIWKNPNDPSGNTPRTINTAPVTQQNNSFAFDAFISGAGDSTSPVWSTLNAAGQSVGSLSFPPYTSNFNCCIVGNLLVPAPGTYTLNITYKDGIIWGIGNSLTGAAPNWAGKGSTLASSGQNQTVALGLPVLPAAQNNGGGGYTGSSTMAITFNQAGVYPIEADWDYWYHSGRVLHITSGSGELTAVTLIAAPPSSTPTGNLTITPGGGTTNLQVVGQPITLSVSISGITYKTVSYCPVLEGTNGDLNLYNDPTNPTFTFQTYNGQPVNKSAAASSIFKLSSLDNSAYQGLFSVGYDGTNFNLNYNGSTANSTASSRVASTSLVIKADDIAWFNSAKNTFDPYVAEGASGGVLFNVEIAYMNKPQVASISPTTVKADGGNYTLFISLNKAFSPLQQGANSTGNTINCSVSIPGATSTGTPNPILDSSGWLTGWNVPFTSPLSNSNQVLNVYIYVQGILTYLSGNSFVTNTVQYIPNTNIGSITAYGTSFTAPTAVNLTTSNPLTSYSQFITSLALTAQVFIPTSNDATSLSFFCQPVGTSNKATIGAGVFQSSSAATINGVTGYLQTFTITFNPQSYLNGSPGSYLGFTAVDTVTNLSCTYTTTIAYSIYNSNFLNGGGGSSGCPATHMYVSPELKVADLVVGDELEAILEYQDEVKLPIQWMEFRDEACYRFETENGAVVIVSESTPVATREALEFGEQGVPLEQLPHLANAIRAGMHVLTNVNGTVEWSMLVETARIGTCRVARLFIGGENFAAGEDANKRIYTHNFSLLIVGGGGARGIVK